jgi:hypothetical protein
MMVAAAAAAAMELLADNDVGSQQFDLMMMHIYLAFEHYYSTEY